MSSSLLILIIPVLLLTNIISVPSSIIIVNAYYSPHISYEDCVSSSCGNSIIQYPFGTCGHLYAWCANGTFFLNFEGIFTGRVLGDITDSSYSNRTLQISPLKINNSSVSYSWLTEQGAFFTLSDEYTIGTMSNCSQQSQFQTVAWLDSRENKSNLFYSQRCTSYPIIIPNNKTYNITADQNFELLYQIGFQITWFLPENYSSCQYYGGRCLGSDLCVCRNNDTADCSTPSYFQRNKLKIEVLRVFILAVYALVFGIVFSAVSCMVIRCKRSAKRTAGDEGCLIRAFMDPLEPRPPSLENFLHYYKSQVPTRYSYSQIKAYTNNLADKIGKGGFGTVYKGKLPSGSVIAVKILDNKKQTEHQFIAEVATVGTTYHINLVRLLGYCSKGSKRALVYEYMVKGSLDRYIHGGHDDELDWKQLYSIAVGTARGIAYLHEECRNRILHCDIKPHNVLLDANFLPKVADFGLAKISKREESHISVVNRGTLGYAAPEMWLRNHGPVTDRADIYSYGMLVMEMVGGRKNIDFDNKESRSSRFFYTEWAFKQVEKGEFGNLRKGNM